MDILATQRKPLLGEIANINPNILQNYKTNPSY